MNVKEQILSDLRNLPLDRAAAAMMREDLASVESTLHNKELPAERREALLREKERIQACLTATEAQTGRMEYQLSLLTPEEQLVLQKMVIAPSRAACLALTDELHCEASSVYRIRARAVAKLIRLRCGVGAESLSKGESPS